ncbi:hypothetical protein QLS31_15210 [Flavobacterium sp. XS2P24]|uniref:hypothetical protein n=1 Tax=Flavobacterium sp. XS2P24 TaxID=3041249 RepID=UPI0024A946E6|nr:hypothetical protein [Flavobacterium sp. XS2P24]MDI6051176.1 hypothetical protein [Flavobacterium sp. XS2P24]
MEQIQIQNKKDRIKSKIESGDFKTLSKILEVPRNTAISRFKRNNEDAVLIIDKIIIEREKVISKLKSKYA